MDCDNRSSLSFQRAIHGPGVDDWTWGRWYWCQSSALELGLWTAYGFPGWETERGVYFTGPEFSIQVGPRRRGSLAEERKAQTDYRVGRYARSRTSIFPGLESHGKPEWYADGLPREDYCPDEDVFRCGALAWQTDVIPGVDVDFSEPDGFLVMDGGGEGGGDMAVAHDCPFPYGSCIRMDGGGEGGGEMVTGEGDVLLLDGGGEGGGEMDEAGLYGLVMDGGGEGGGEMDESAVAGMGMDGGGEGGGEMMHGSVPYSTGFTYTPYEATITTTILLPTFGEGDVTFAIGIIPSETITIDTPPGWTLLITGPHPGTVLTTFYVFYIIHEPGDDLDVTFEMSTTTLNEWLLVNYGDCGTPNLPTVNSGNNANPTHPGITVPTDAYGTVFFLVLATNGLLNSPTTPDEFGKVAPLSGNERILLYDSHEQLGATGTVGITVANGRQWCTLMWNCDLNPAEPPPPPPPPP